MKNDRLFGIIYLLLANETMTARELATYFEVSTRTIYRDIETLSKFEIPIYMIKGKNGGVGLLDNYKLDKTLLTEDEQNQILFSLQGLNKLQTDKNGVYEKIKNMFSKEYENWFEVDFSAWENSIEHEKNFELIKKAIIDKKVIEFLYFNSYGTHAKRKVEPLKLCFKYNSWYLCGYDIAKSDYRFYKIMRMKNLKLTGETFVRSMPNLKEPADKRPIKTTKLTLKIDESQSYRVYDEFDSDNVEKLAEGGFIVKVEFPLNDWVYGYILSFGHHIEVLKPEDIRLEIIDILKKSLDNYS